MNKYIISAAAEKMCRFAASRLNFDEAHAFWTGYKSIVEGYRESRLAIYSTLKLEEYSPFQEWLSWLVSNKNKVIPLLICNMLRGDIYALKIYELIQKASSSSDILLSHLAVYEDEDLLAKCRDVGGGEPGMAILNAEKWLASEEAAKIDLKSTMDNTAHYEKHSDLCVVNGMLGIHNEFIQCPSEYL